MNFPQKRQVNVAAVSKRKHDLSHMHIGTLDFGRIKPIECRYMVPGDEFNINVLNETRVLNAMPSPTIGQFDVVYRHFFVPIHNIWHGFYDFLKNQQPIIDGVPTTILNAPYIKLGTIIGYVTNTSNGLVTIVNNPTTLSAWDFNCLYNNGSQGTQTIYYAWTRKGRILNDFLTSLGINIPYGGTNYGSEWNIRKEQKLYIILPLVCFWKFYFDWIVPSRYVRQHQDYIEYLISGDLYTSNSSGMSADNFFTYLVHEPLAYYIDDIFTTCTEFPFSDPNYLQDDILISNPDSGVSSDVYASSTSSDGSGSTVIGSDSTNFNMYTLQTLGKLQDLLNRNLIAGTKVQDWLLTEFGLRPNNDALHLSTYLGSKRTTLSVSDVISNADTEAQGGTPLGAYAGYVNNKQQFDFGYKSMEHGFYFITVELVPRTSYYQGLAAQFDMGDRFDFFQPEFDNQQGEPVPFRRLFFSHKYHEQLARYDNVFGFNLQYSGLKFANDVVSGDFRTRFGLQLKSWFLGRDMSYISDEDNEINGIDEEFCLVKSQYQDWHYIFSDTNDNLDPFLVAFYFKFPAMRPMKSVTEGFEPTYQQSGKNVSLDFSGSVK